MQDLIADLMNVYTDYLFLINEYNVLNERLKEYVKLKGGKLLINGYSFRIEERDKSFYLDEVKDYLLSNNLTRFLKKDIDNRKIKDAIDKDILSRDLVLESIKTDKTVLDIIVPSLNETIESYKESLSRKELDVSSMAERRLELKNIIKNSKWKYYNRVNVIKDNLRQLGISEYRFEFDNSIGLIRMRIVGRVYYEDFILSCEDIDLDVFKYAVDDKKLRASKIKKIINDENILKGKVEKKVDYLYIRKLEKRTIS